MICSEAVEIYNGDGAVVFSRRGCDSFPRGLAVEIPFADRPSLTLEVLLSSRYSYTRIQYTVLDKLLSAGEFDYHSLAQNKADISSNVVPALPLQATGCNKLFENLVD